ncbi:Pectate lyase superfamily protein [Anatilimnocola aggregata]|uniref:Pectate lyase superfamily protein n=1 Tax=Anatilimnocola aggregata TaxID=2528021 RepID=A0A517Y661_9BACT|nr:right-handed parallel beta-helix repeat-containing protein [Anatilimnocola aggregata]QDU25706.1 Pectate lyase superfamily protein [Anatilimnocola aggregata]
MKRFKSITLARRQAILLSLAAGGAVLGAWIAIPAEGQAPQPAISRNTPSLAALLQVADGEADASPALQRAIDQSAGAIVLPPGTYLLKKTLVVDLARVGFTSLDGQGVATLKMVGDGPALKFVGTHGGTAAPESVKPGVWQKERAPLVRDLEIIGPKVPDEQTAADGIEADGTMQLTLRGVVIRHVRHAVHLVNRNRNVLIDGCHLYENSGIGVYYDHVNLHQSNISACHISYCRQGGIVNRGGDVRNIHISGCDIEANMPEGEGTAANILLDSTGGSVAEVAIVGCTIQHSMKCANGANIRVLGKATWKRMGKETFEQCGHITIADNVLSDVQTNIELREARGVTITGNTFWQGYKHNLDLENCTQLVIGNNAMERNPLYGYTSEANNTVVLKNCTDCTITALHLHHTLGGKCGLLLEDCRRINLTNSTLLDCQPVAIMLHNVTDSRISDCLIRDDLKPESRAPALVVTGGKGNMVVDNRLVGQVSLDDPKNHHVEGNYTK